MKRFFKAWNEWWFRKVPPHGIAVFRIVFSFYLLIVWSIRFLNFEMLYTDRGIAIPLYDLPSSVDEAGTIAVLLMASLLLMFVGYFFRTATLGAFLGSVYFYVLGGHMILSTMDSVVFFLLFVLIFSGADQTYSLHMKRKHGSWAAWRHVSVLPQRIIAVQISAMYLTSGLFKLVAPDWQTGLMLKHSFRSILGTRFAFAFVKQGWSEGTYDLLTHAVKILELALPIGVWLPRIRGVFFLLGFLFHLLIALFLGLWWFLLLPCTYILFVPPERTYRLFFHHFGAPANPTR